eukprot:Phypoly_transcript_01845.p1 GENE.Phypoly_transcript_01845~~Phypoly_transcript_01845.p1  ORF type:complete len:1027 (+),score=219.57 Phypoly_transcript_01845:43-3081(+)
MADLSIGGVQRLTALVQTGSVIEEPFILQIIDIKKSVNPRGTAFAVRLSDGEASTTSVVDIALSKDIESGEVSQYSIVQLTRCVVVKHSTRGHLFCQIHAWQPIQNPGVLVGAPGSLQSSHSTQSSQLSQFQPSQFQQVPAPQAPQNQPPPPQSFQARFNTNNNVNNNPQNNANNNSFNQGNNQNQNNHNNFQNSGGNNFNNQNNGGNNNQGNNFRNGGNNVNNNFNNQVNNGNNNSSNRGNNGNNNFNNQGNGGNDNFQGNNSNNNFNNQGNNRNNNNFSNQGNNGNNNFNNQGNNNQGNFNSNQGSSNQGNNNRGNNFYANMGNGGNGANSGNGGNGGNREKFNRGSGKIVPVKSLHPNYGKWTIKVRVTQKNARTYQNDKGPGFMINLDLLDAHGDQIRLTLFNDNARHFDSSFEVGRVVTITGSDFNVKVANKNYSPNADFELMNLSKYNEVEPCEDDGSIAPLKIASVPIRSIADIPKDTMIDVVGVVMHVGDRIDTKSQRTSENTARRAVTIGDSSGACVELTLWHAKAVEWNAPVGSVVALRGARVQEYMGKTLSMVATSSISINPHIPESQALTEWYESVKGQPEAVMSLRKQDAPRASTSVNYGEHTLKSMTEMFENSTLEKADFSVVAFLFRNRETNEVQPQHPWYLACPTDRCMRKVQEIHGKYYCAQCKEEFESCSRRYIANFPLYDETAKVFASVFNETATFIFEMSADDLYNLEQTNYPEYRLRFYTTYGTRYRFEIRASRQNYNGNLMVKYVVQKAQALDYGNEARAMYVKLVESINNNNTTPLAITYHTSNDQVGNNPQYGNNPQTVPNNNNQYGNSGNNNYGNNQNGNNNYGNNNYGNSNQNRNNNFGNNNQNGNNNYGNNNYGNNNQNGNNNNANNYGNNGSNQYGNFNGGNNVNNNFNTPGGNNVNKMNQMNNTNNRNGNYNNTGNANYNNGNSNGGNYNNNSNSGGLNDSFGNNTSPQKPNYSGRNFNTQQSSQVFQSSQPSQNFQNPPYVR